MQDKIVLQHENLGYVSTAIPSLSEDYYYVLEYDKNWLTLYQLNSGDQLKIKIRKKTWNKNPINNKDFIKILKVQPEGKFRKDGENWIQSKTEFEDILQDYTILTR